MDTLRHKLTGCVQQPLFIGDARQNRLPGVFPIQQRAASTCLPQLHHKVLNFGIFWHQLLRHHADGSRFEGLGLARSGLPEWVFFLGQLLHRPHHGVQNHGVHVSDIKLRSNLDWVWPKQGKRWVSTQLNHLKPIFRLVLIQPHGHLRQVVEPLLHLL